MKPFAIASVLAFLLTTASIFAAQPLVDEEYDRLDGHGPSGKKVNVIEWEGNLEIHVYPGGSLAGLSMKIDRSQKNPVMVIGYRFNDQPSKVLIRRAILGIDLSDRFMTYRDPSVSEYDKIIVSNNGLSSQVVAYKLDPAPDQLYPDGHPKNQMSSQLARSGDSQMGGQELSGRASAYGPAERQGPHERMPASAGAAAGAAAGARNRGREGDSNTQMGPAPRKARGAAEHRGQSQDAEGRAGYFNW